MVHYKLTLVSSCEEDGKGVDGMQIAKRKILTEPNFTDGCKQNTSQLTSRIQASTKKIYKNGCTDRYYISPPIMLYAR